jgi:hypothetical protein
VYPDMIFVTVSDNYSIVNNVPLKEMWFAEKPFPDNDTGYNYNQVFTTGSFSVVGAAHKL